MKNNAILVFLLFLMACGNWPVKKGKQSGSELSSGNKEYSSPDRRDEDQMITRSEERLHLLVDQFIQQNNLEEFKEAPEKQFNTRLVRPVIATTNAEISRLKVAWESSGPEHEVVASRFAKVDEAIVAGLTFPPEGGQHNQWYQCDSCQVGLRTIDAHHHQCPSCNKIYSGFPYDHVLYSRQHSQNLSLAEDAAWAWAITGKEKYAKFAAAVLVGYGDRYLNFPMFHTSVNDRTIDIEAEKQGKYRTAGRLHAQTLSEASSMIPAAIAYDLIYNTLSEKQKQHIEKNFLRAMAENINSYKSGKSNWQTWHNAALLYAGAVMGDGSMVRQALLDDKNGFIAQMKISVMPEGMWYENSWGYHYYTLSAMTLIAEGSRRLGFDLYNFPALRKMYFIAFDYLMADGSLPRFGDAVQDSPLGKAVNEKAYATYKDDRFLAGLPSALNWDGIALGRNAEGEATLPQPESKLIPGAGHAILATDGAGQLTAALTFGPYGGFHGHFDKLSFVLFGYGQELGVDPGRSASQAYRLPIHREWYKATAGHNTVLVDGRSQGEADGKYLAFNSSSSYAAVTAEAGPAFENVSHTRFMLLSPDYLLVIDELKPDDDIEHTYDWLYHNKGQEVKCPLPLNTPLLEKSSAGYTYLKDIIAYNVGESQSIETTFIGEKTSLYMTMAGEEGDEVFTATGPHKSVEDRVPLVIVRRKGRTVRFATVLEPVASTGKPTVKSIRLIPGPESKVIVVHEEGEDHISFTNGELDHFKIHQETASGSKNLLKH